MGKITGDDIQYKLEHPERERNWRTYEQEFSRRIKMAMKDLDPLVNQAVSTIHIIHGPGHPHSLTIEQRVKLLLIKQLVGESNRMFANMLDIFSMLSGIVVSYKVSLYRFSQFWTDHKAYSTKISQNIPPIPLH